MSLTVNTSNVSDCMLGPFGWVRTSSLLFLLAHGYLAAEADMACLTEAVFGFPCFLEHRPYLPSSLTPERSNDLHPCEPTQQPTMAHKRCSLSCCLIPAAQASSRTQCLLQSWTAPKGGCLMPAGPLLSPGCWEDMIAVSCSPAPNFWYTHFKPMRCSSPLML